MRYLRKKTRAVLVEFVKWTAQMDKKVAAATFEDDQQKDRDDQKDDHQSQQIATSEEAKL